MALNLVADPRHAAALLVVAATLAFAAWPTPPTAPSGDFEVHVVGPAGPLHAGTVHVADATELAVVLALAERDGFEVQWDDRPGCTYDYVRGIAGHQESATGGWNFYLRSGGGDWAWQPRSASCPGLQAGDDVLWCWVDADERCAVYP